MIWILLLIIIAITTTFYYTYIAFNLPSPIFKEIPHLPREVLDNFINDEQQGHKERGYNLDIHRVYEVINPSLTSRFKKVLKRDKTKQLYHGSNYNNIISICKSGFNLPSRRKRNMFGPGIYLSTVPQKAFEYTDMSSLIIICDTIISNSMQVNKSCTNFNPDKDLIIRKWHGLKKKKYHSLHAPAGACTISTEHVIFTPEHILPRYVIHVL